MFTCRIKYDITPLNKTQSISLILTLDLNPLDVLLSFVSINTLLGFEWFAWFRILLNMGNLRHPSDWLISDELFTRYELFNVVVVVVNDGVFIDIVVCNDSGNDGGVAVKAPGSVGNPAPNNVAAAAAAAAIALGSVKLFGIPGKIVPGCIDDDDEDVMNGSSELFNDVLKPWKCDPIMEKFGPDTIDGNKCGGNKFTGLFPIWLEGTVADAVVDDEIVDDGWSPNPSVGNDPVGIVRNGLNCPNWVLNPKLFVQNDVEPVGILDNNWFTSELVPLGNPNELGYTMELDNEGFTPNGDGEFGMVFDVVIVLGVVVVVIVVVCRFPVVVVVLTGEVERDVFGGFIIG